MDETHFDELLRALTNSRRSLLGGGLAVATGWLGGTAVDARKKGKRKKRKPKKAQPNAYGCLNVGQPCQGDSALCCSGICEGTAPKKGKKATSRCVAPCGTEPPEPISEQETPEFRRDTRKRTRQ